MSNARITL